MSPFDPIRLDGPGGTVEVCTHGAHVLRFTPAGGSPALFVSRASRFAAGEPIRGGVPVIFPWFGDDPEGRGRAAHGFARRLAWRSGERTTTRATLVLEDDAATRALWPHRFALELSVDVGAAGLAIGLVTTNRGTAPFRFENALHTYFVVGDVRRVAVEGLGGATFIDKLAGGQRVVQGADPITFAAETDRIYVGTDATCSIDDPELARRITIAKSGARSTIVWNPWIAKAARMADFGDDEWPGMLCIESGNVAEDAVELGPGVVHRLGVRIDCTTTP